MFEANFNQINFEIQLNDYKFEKLFLSTYKYTQPKLFEKSNCKFRKAMCCLCWKFQNQ